MAGLRLGRGIRPTDPTSEGELDSSLAKQTIAQLPGQVWWFTVTGHGHSDLMGRNLPHTTNQNPQTDQNPDPDPDPDPDFDLDSDLDSELDRDVDDLDLGPEPDSSSIPPTNVVPLNDAGAVFDALATGIRGTAVGWPPGALEKLEAALHSKYGHLIGGQAAVERLLILAKQPSAA